MSADRQIPGADPERKAEAERLSQIDPRVQELADEYYGPLNAELSPELRGKVLSAILKLAERTSGAEQRAETDSFTGLLNRETFFKKFDEKLGKREKGRSFMVALDLDYLNRINRLASHEGGDIVIRGIAAALKGVLRKSKTRETVDLAARAGGDEFYVMLNEVPDREAARSIVTRLADAVSKIHIPGYDHPISLSIGVVEIPPTDTPSHENLVRLSERARGLSKANGRGSFTMLSVKDENVDKDLNVPAVSFVTRQFGRDSEKNPSYDMILASGDIETAKSSRDACLYEVQGSLERVQSEIEATLNGDMDRVFRKYNVKRFLQLSGEQVVDILVAVRNGEMDKLLK